MAAMEANSAPDCALLNDELSPMWSEFKVKNDALTSFLMNNQFVFVKGKAPPFYAWDIVSISSRKYKRASS